MAEGSGEEGFIDVINRGEDLHCFVGSMMMGRTITKADKDERTKAKTINFMKPYGGGPPKLADLLSISMEESKRLFVLYEQAFPQLNKWLAQQSAEALKNSYSKTFAPCKRRRWYPEKRELTDNLKNTDFKRYMQIKGSIERNGSNQPIQGTGADMTKEALVKVRSLVKHYNDTYHTNVAYLICTVHDQIDCEVVDYLAEEFAKRKEEIMIECAEIYLKRVKIKVDVTISKVLAKIEQFSFVKVVISDELAADEDLCIFGRVFEVDDDSEITRVTQDIHEDDIEVPAHEAIKVIMYAKNLKNNMYYLLDEFEDAILLPFKNTDEILTVNLDLQNLPPYFICWEEDFYEEGANNTTILTDLQFKQKWAKYL